MHRKNEAMKLKLKMNHILYIKSKYIRPVEVFKVMKCADSMA